MMYRMTIRFFGYCALLCAIVMIGCGGAEERKAKYLERGISYFNEKNYDKAKVEFKNVLQIDPKSAEPYYYLGQINESQEELRTAYFMYTKALDLKPDYLEVELKLARLYLSADQVDNAEKLIESIAKKKPDDLDTKFLQAMLKYKKNEQDEAVKALQDILAADPRHVESSSTLAAIYFGRDNMESAAKVLTDALAYAGDDVRLLRQLMGVYERQGNTDKLEELFLKVIALEPDDLKYRAGLAGLYARNGDIGKGEEVLREAVSRDSRNVDAYLLLAKYLVENESSDSAEKELKDAVERDQESYAARFALAELYIFEKKPEMARDIYKEIVDRQGDQPDGLRARNKLAAYSYMLGEYEAAEKQVDKVLSVNPKDNEALSIQGRIYLQEDRPEDAINSFRALLKDQPNSPEIFALLSEAHKKNNEPLLANEALMNAIASNPDNIALRLQLAGNMMEAKDYEDAEQVITRALQDSPDNIDALKKMADLKLATGQIDDLGDVAGKIVSTHPEDPTGYFGLGKLYSWRKNYPEALKQFNLAFEKSPDDYILISAIAATYLSMEDPDGAIAWLNQHETADNSHYIHAIKGEVMASQKKYDEAADLFRQVISARKDWAVPYTNLANLNMLRDDKTAAIAVMKEAVDANPDNLQLQLGYGNILLQAGVPDEALSVYLGAIDGIRGGEVFLDRAVTVLLDAKGDDASIARANSVIDDFAKKHPKSPFPKLMKARVSLKQGDRDGALARVNEALALDERNSSALRMKEELLRALDRTADLKALYAGEKELSPNNPAPYTGLGNLYLRENNYEAALAEFEAASRLYSDKSETLGPIVGALMGMGRMDEAENRVKAYLDENPESSSAYSLLGDIYREKKDIAKARDAYEKSVGLAPQWNRPVMSLANILMQAGDQKTALKVLADGLDRMPENRGIRMVMAGVYEKAGNAAEAEKIYLDLISKDESDVNTLLLLAGLYERSHQIDKAIDIYEKAVKVDGDNVIAANNLAVMLVDFRPDKAGLERARTLISSLEQSDHPALQDTVGWVLYKTGDVDGALAALSKAVAAAPDLKQINYHIGMVYYAKGDMENARKYLGIATTNAGEDAYLGLNEAKKTLESLQRQ